MTDIDLTNARQLLADAITELQGLDGVRPEAMEKDKDLPARKAAIRRKLTYAGHLTEAAKVEIYNQYYLFAGEDPPEVIP